MEALICEQTHYTPASAGGGVDTAPRLSSPKCLANPSPRARRPRSGLTSAAHQDALAPAREERPRRDARRAAPQMPGVREAFCGRLVFTEAKTINRYTGLSDDLPDKIAKY